MSRGRLTAARGAPYAARTPEGGVDAAGAPRAASLQSAHGALNAFPPSGHQVP